MQFARFRIKRNKATSCSYRYHLPKQICAYKFGRLTGSRQESQILTWTSYSPIAYPYRCVQVTYLKLFQLIRRVNFGTIPTDNANMNGGNDAHHASWRSSQSFDRRRASHDHRPGLYTLGSNQSNASIFEDVEMAHDEVRILPPRSWCSVCCI